MPTAPPIYDFLDPPDTGDADAVGTAGDGGVVEGSGSATDLGRLGHYRVISELGRGGMGYVFEAEDIKLKRRVALKVMNQKIAATEGSRTRFISEARAMAAIRHDNVATIFEVGQHGEVPFMAMEMLAGQTVEALNKSAQRLDYETIIQYARQIAAGLAAAHARGIVHRDIKPANIWIEEGNGRIKILDFGLALAQTPVDSMAGRGSVIGTPGYLSPEQARSEPLDDRSDLYSLGAVLYELCTGQLPIQARTVHEQLIAILTRKPVRIETLNSEIPKPLCDLIYRCLRKEPRARFSSAESIVQELERVHVECDRSSEVAQTIGKLKSSLDSVFEKSSAPLDSLPTANPLENQSQGGAGSGSLVGFDDALASLPAAGSISSGVIKTPVGLPPSSLPPSGSSGAIPVVRKSKTEGSGGSGGDASPLKTYLPILAVVGCLLLALPIMTYAFTGLGRSNDNIILQPQTTNQAQPPTASPSGATGDVATSVNSQPAANSQFTQAYSAAEERAVPTPISDNRSVPPEPPPGSDDSTAFALEDSTTSELDGSMQEEGSPQPQRSGGAANSNPTTSASRNEMGFPSDLTPSPNRSSSPAGLPRDLSSTANSPPPAVVEPTPEEPQLQIESISTGDGKGADAMVQVQSSTEFGGNNAIGVRIRNGVETNHSYLRFDLSSLGKVRSHIKQAKLVLRVVGDEDASGAELKLFGVDLSPLWPEDKIVWKLSYSQQGLESSMTALGSTTVQSGEQPPGHVEIASDELAGFIRKLKSDTLTVVVSGQHGNELLRFVSKEQSDEQAPRLVLGIGSADE